MAARQPITHFGLQASNSAKKHQRFTQANTDQATPSTGAARGVLRFVEPSGASRMASSPIVIDDDPVAVTQTASSWGEDEYMLAEQAEHDPYDETWRPPERDSEDETMATTFRKTRQQPQRAASTRKPADRHDALFAKTTGMWTPPATSGREGRKVTAGSAARRRDVSEGRQNDHAPVTSDPVDTPVPGPSRKPTNHKTSLTRPGSEIHVEAPLLMRKPSSSRTVPAIGSSTNIASTATDVAKPAEREKQWLSKRSTQAPAKGIGIQTKMTAFTTDKAPKKLNHGSNGRRLAMDVDMALPTAANGDVEDDDVFEESVRFVGMRNKDSAMMVRWSDDAVQVERPSIPKLPRSSTSTRPLPRKKKRKSDEIDQTSNTAISEEPKETATVRIGGAADGLSTQLKAHKRFKKQHNLQTGATGLSSENDLDATSSLTSLSTGPSSDLEDGAEQEPAVSGLRVVRGRSGRAMQVVCSSDVEEQAEEAEQTGEAIMTSNKATDKSPPVQSPLSSLVPDSQPWHALNASLVELVRFRPEAAPQKLPLAKAAPERNDELPTAVPTTKDKQDFRYPSPESMIENVQTLATWSPAKYATLHSVGAARSQAWSREAGKENQPLLSPQTNHSNTRPPVSPDEVIEGTFGPIDSLHLLETYHRGYTPKKESAVQRREQVMPRATIRMLREPAVKTAFPEVDQAWRGVGGEDSTPKAMHPDKRAQNKSDTFEQSKLASFGFLKNENVRKLRAVDFDRDFEDEDNLLPEDEAMVAANAGRRSLSPTPRKAQAGKVLGSVPVPPIDPRLQPAGAREVHRRNMLQEMSTEVGPAGSEIVTAQDANAKRTPDRGEGIVPSSQPSENQQDILNSDSSADMVYQARLRDYQGALAIFS